MLNLLQETMLALDRPWWIEYLWKAIFAESGDFDLRVYQLEVVDVITCFYIDLKGFSHDLTKVEVDEVCFILLLEFGWTRRVFPSILIMCYASFWCVALSCALQDLFFTLIVYFQSYLVTLAYRWVACHKMFGGVESIGSYLLWTWHGKHFLPFLWKHDSHVVVVRLE